MHGWQLHRCRTGLHLVRSSRSSLVATTGSVGLSLLLAPLVGRYLFVGSRRLAGSDGRFLASM